MTQDLTLTSEQVTPAKGLVIVKPTELPKGEEATDTGIVLNLEQNQSIVDRPTSGTVVSVSVDTYLYKPGMTVLWLDTEGQDLQLKNGNFLVLREESIIGFKNE